MLKFVDDLAGAIYDFFKFILSCLSYFFTGVLIVGLPLFFLAKLFEWLYK